MCLTKTVGNYYYFGELKSGDIFRYQGQEYEKVSGNLADRLGGKTGDSVEILSDSVVRLLEVY